MSDEQSLPPDQQSEQNKEEVKEEEKFDINLFAKKWRSEQTSQEYQIEQAIGKELLDALKSVVVLSNSFDYELIVAYCGLPSVLCDILPILYIEGFSGSGKSQVTKFMSRALGQPLISGASTAASLKNEINRLRWYDPDSFMVEKNCHVIIDNANEEMFLGVRSP